MTLNRMMYFANSCLITIAALYGTLCYLKTLPQSSLSRPVEVTVVQDAKTGISRVMIYHPTHFETHGIAIARVENGRDLILGTLKPGMDERLEDKDVKGGERYTYKAWPLSDDPLPYTIPITMEVLVPSIASCLTSSDSAQVCRVD